MTRENSPNSNNTTIQTNKIDTNQTNEIDTGVNVNDIKTKRRRRDPEMEMENNEENDQVITNTKMKKKFQPKR